MITLKLAGYTREELQMLHQILRNGVQVAGYVCEPAKITCDTCPYRHICGDLVRAEAFAYKQLKSGKI